jgi:hypothetical protein
MPDLTITRVFDVPRDLVGGCRFRQPSFDASVEPGWAGSYPIGSLARKPSSEGDKTCGS